MTIDTSGRRPPTHYKPPLVSWEEYLPWALANEFPSEWVDGRIVDVVAQNVRSNMMVQFLHEMIAQHVPPLRRGLLIFNFLMRLPDRPSGRVPDLMFISDEHLDRVKETYLDGPADLAIEIVSIDSLVRDQHDKFLEYAASGVREYWLIDQLRSEAHFYVLGKDSKYHEAQIGPDGIYTSTVLPSLRLRVDWLWRDKLPTVDEALANLPN